MAREWSRFALQVTLRGQESERADSYLFLKKKSIPKITSSEKARGEPWDWTNTFAD